MSEFASFRSFSYDLECNCICCCWSSHFTFLFTVARTLGPDISYFLFSVMSDSDIATWLISNCGIGASKASMVADRLATECWVDRVEALQTLVADHPESLDVLDFPKPMLAILKSKIVSFNNKNVVDLSTHDVQYLLLRTFPAEHYGETFRKNRINGFVLNSASNAQRLIDWGVSSPIHAEALWNTILVWKEKGVPNSFLARDDQESVTTDSSSVIYLYSFSS